MRILHPTKTITLLGLVVTVLTAALTWWFFHTRLSVYPFDVITSIALSPDRTTIGVVSYSYTPKKNGVFGVIEITLLGALLAGADSPRIWIGGSSGSEKLQITEAYTEPEVRAIEFSPDGRKLLYVTRPDYSASQSGLMELDVLSGASTSLLVSSHARVRVPRYSPNGRLVGYVDNMNRPTLSIMDIVSRTVADVDRNVRPMNWCWSDDSISIYYTDARNVHQYEVSRKTSRLVSRVPEDIVRLVLISENSLAAMLVDRIVEIDIASGLLSTLVSCRSVIDCDGDRLGLCLVEATNSESESSVVFIDTRSQTSETILRGFIKDARWLNGEIVVWMTDDEIRSYDPTNKYWKIVCRLRDRLPWRGRELHVN